MAGGLMLACGLFGFIAISMFWIIPGLLLIIGGILTFLAKDKNVKRVTN
jgi:TM2 domain-containing membrane protein YozV